ncbi:MAG: hypothetical protein V1798_00565 [Pseudomonadota bacterium]
MKRATDRGGSALWILILFLGLFIWAGYRVGRLYFDRSAIESEIASLGDEALTMHDAQIQDKIASVLTSYNASFDKEKINVQVNPKGDRITIHAGYYRMADLGFFQIPLHFEVNVERVETKAGSVIQSVRQSLEDSENASIQRYEKAVKAAQAPTPPVGE